MHCTRSLSPSYLPAGHPSSQTPPWAAPGCRLTWRKVRPAGTPPRLDSSPPTSLWRAAPSPPAETWSPSPSASTDLTSRDGRWGIRFVAFQPTGPPFFIHTNAPNVFPSPLISLALVSSCLLSSSVSLGIPSSSSFSLSNQAKKTNNNHDVLQLID